MTISAGASSKGRVASGSSATSTGVTTAASGSAFLMIVFWSGSAFTSVTDSKSNVYTQIDTEITVGGADHCRAYYCENGVGGASHTATLNLSGSAFGPGVMFQEIPGGALSGILDQHNRRDDTSSPFTLASALTPSQADELAVTAIIGNSPSNPATMAESGLGSSTLQTNTQETDGTQFFCCAIATKVISSTAALNPSWTQSGATAAAVWLFTFKQAAAGGLIVNPFSGRGGSAAQPLV